MKTMMILTEGEPLAAGSSDHRHRPAQRSSERAGADRAYAPSTPIPSNIMLVFPTMTSRARSLTQRRVSKLATVAWVSI